MFGTVTKFVDAFERRSTAECLACFKQSDSHMTYGMAADEMRIGVEALREQSDRLVGIAFGKHADDLAYLC